MRRNLALAAAAALLVPFVLVDSRPVHAAEPSVTSVVEGHDRTLGRVVVVLFGNRVSKFKEWRVLDAGGTDIGSAELVMKSGKIIALRLPESVTAGEYTLKLIWKKGEVLHPCSIAAGGARPGTILADALESALRDELDDAESLGGWDSSYYRNVDNVNAGALHTDHFDAYADLAAAAKIGTAGDQVSAGDHAHPGYDFTAGAGLILSGTQFSAAYDGTGTAKTLARSDHLHEGLYAREKDLETAGKINTADNPVHWTKLVGVPVGFADGVDNDTNTTYRQGTGLLLAGTTFSVDFGKTASEVAPGNHDHSSTYVNRSGDTMSGQLHVTSAAGDHSVIGSQTAKSGAAYGLHGENFSTSSGGGVLGHALGTSGAATGVFGLSASTSGYAVQGLATATTGTAYGARFETKSTHGVGLYSLANASSGPSFGGWFHSRSSTGTALYAKADSTSTALHYGLKVDHYGGGYGALIDQHSTSGGAVGLAVNSRAGNGWGIYVDSVQATGLSYGVYSRMASEDGVAVLGFAKATSGSPRAVWALTDSTGGIGCHGEARATTGTTYGVHGESDSKAGVGVLAESTRAGGTGLVAAVGTTTAVGQQIARFRVGTSDKHQFSINGDSLQVGVSLASQHIDTSDARLKQDVTPVTGVLAKLAGIRTVRYRLKDRGDGVSGPHVGVIAQEAQEHFPELVHERADGYLGVSYGGVAALALQAVKEQQARIDAQQRTIEAQRKEIERLSELEKRLARLEDLLRERPDNTAASVPGER